MSSMLTRRHFIALASLGCVSGEKRPRPTELRSGQLWYRFSRQVPRLVECVYEDRGVPTVGYHFLFPSGHTKWGDTPVSEALQFWTYLGTLAEMGGGQG